MTIIIINRNRNRNRNRKKDQKDTCKNDNGDYFWLVELQGFLNLFLA